MSLYDNKIYTAGFLLTEYFYTNFGTFIQEKDLKLTLEPCSLLLKPEITPANFRTSFKGPMCRI